MSGGESTREGVAASLRRAPVIGVVRTDALAEAETLARGLIAAGVELVEVTFTVPEAPELVQRLLLERGPAGPPWIGMGTVTDGDRVDRALAAGAEFIVSPNASAAVAEPVNAAGVYFVCGALTPTEIVAARELGANLVKVYPLPPVGGARYLSTVRGPLGDVPMLAAGGFGVDEIPEYRGAGAIAFGMAATALLADEGAAAVRALAHARGARP
ncbi:MAG: bifunctional 4-hydroxy-2-oxoglutarate aldolase/2-dehydro-3-deoxy-phosphogluconate aldolase [Thermoanaerobaculia bacterium]